MNIKDIVEQVQETPSPRCWESIASQLPAVGTAIGGGVAATAAKGTMAAGKLAVIIGSTVAVVAVITGTTIAILTHKPKTEQQAVNQSSTTITITDSTATEDNTNTETTFLLVQAETEQAISSQETPTTTSSSVKSTVEEPAVTSPIANTPVSSATPNSATLAPIATISTQNVSSATNSNSTTNSTPEKTSASNNTPTQTANSSSNPKTRQDNDMTTNSQNEEWSFSQPVVIEIPNVFTPNGDGVNDLFVINGIESCEKRALIVKNQSGQTVFQSNLYDNSWDGSNLPNGTYYYQFSYSINNISELRRGTILIRR